jgi:peptidyl-prolyl cis-trans isomerase D
MRQTIQNVGLLVIVLSLSAVFLLEFGGPQSQGCAPGASSGYAARVYGDTVTLGELKAAYIMANGPSYSTETARQMKLKELVLEGLIERDLLAREARELGFTVSQDDVMLRLAEEGVVYTSAPVGAPTSIPNGPQPLSFEDKDGNFSADNARRFIQNRLGRSIEEFAVSQINETLAQRVRDLVATSVTVSPNEVWDAFVRERDQVELAYVKFDLGYYRNGITLSAADVDAYMKEHGAEIDAEYEKEKHRYTGLEKQVHARHILVKVASDADEATRTAARKKAEGLRLRALAGEDFAQLARATSEDQGSAPQGGDLGYNTKGKMVPSFDEAQFALQAGEVSDVVESRFGYHVIKVEGVREGDVPVAEAKREIAEQKALNARADMQAKAAAEAALAALKRGESIEELTARLESDKKAAGDSPLAPVVKDTRPFGRGANPIAGAESAELSASAFELTEDAPLADAPIKAGESWVVFKLKKRDRAVKEDFAGAEQERLSDALLRRKRMEIVDTFVRSLRKRADNEGAVSINPRAIEYAAGEETASL